MRDKDYCHRWFDPLGINSLSEERLTRDLHRGQTAGDVNIFLPDSLINIAYNFGAQEEILSGKNEQERIDANNNFYQWLLQRENPLVYMLTGHYY